MDLVGNMRAWNALIHQDHPAVVASMKGDLVCCLVSRLHTMADSPGSIGSLCTFKSESLLLIHVLKIHLV